jgi:peptide/nickel transport system substrate-binding protein
LDVADQTDAKGLRELKKIVGIMVILFLACFTFVLPAMAMSRSNVVIVATPEDPTTLDPGTAYDPKSRLVIRNCYNTLVSMEGTSAGIVTGELAGSWKISDEGRRYTFYLRKGIEFQGGGGLTANDVKYSIERTLHLGQGPGNQLKFIKAVDVSDPYTVTFVLNHPVPWFLTLLAQTGASIVNSQKVKSHCTKDDPFGQNWLHDHVAGSGPYALKS